MTTGRINQVAFLGDTTTRTTPDAVETRGRDGRGSRSYRARAGLEMGGRRGGGPWAERDGGSRPTVRCTSTEPADTDSPITAHATLRTRDSNPDERTTATRASGNTRARSCPHRWTRRGSQRDKQQAGREGSRRDKRQAAGGNDRDNHAGGCLPRLGRRRPGLGSRHVTPRARGLQGEPTHGRAHGNLMPRPRQRRALPAT